MRALRRLRRPTASKSRHPPGRRAGAISPRPAPARRRPRSRPVRRVPSPVAPRRLARAYRRSGRAGRGREPSRACTRSPSMRLPGVACHALASKATKYRLATAPTASAACTVAAVSTATCARAAAPCAGSASSAWARSSGEASGAPDSRRSSIQACTPSSQSKAASIARARGGQPSHHNSGDSSARSIVQASVRWPRPAARAVLTKPVVPPPRRDGATAAPSGCRPRRAGTSAPLAGSARGRRAA